MKLVMPLTSTIPSRVQQTIHSARQMQIVQLTATGFVIQTRSIIISMPEQVYTVSPAAPVPMFVHLPTITRSIQKQIFMSYLQLLYISCPMDKSKGTGRYVVAIKGEPSRTQTQSTCILWHNDQFCAGHLFPNRKYFRNTKRLPSLHRLYLPDDNWCCSDSYSDSNTNL